jgi:hypothetical protein
MILIFRIQPREIKYPDKVTKKVTWAEVGHLPQCGVLFSVDLIMSLEDKSSFPGSQMMEQKGLYFGGTMALPSLKPDVEQFISQ